MVRRMNGEGSLHKCPDGRWELRIMLGYHDNVRPKYKHFYSRAKKKVQDKLNPFREDQRSGIDLSHNYTFAEWSEGGMGTTNPTSRPSRRKTISTF